MDYIDEIRQILSEAVGVNDNASPAPAAGAVFHGPVTVNVTIGAAPDQAALQRLVLMERLRGFLAAEGAAVAAAFHAEVERDFGRALAELSDDQLGTLLRRFGRIIQAARLLAGMAHRPHLSRRSAHSRA